MRPVCFISCFRIARLALISLLPLFMTIASAKASTVSMTPTLPVPGATYTSITGGTLTLGSVVSDTFSPSGQNIVSNVTYAGLMTPIGSLTLTGTIDQDVIGRSSSTATGSWTTDLLSLSLSGIVLGQTLTVGLSPSQTSSGTTSIVPSGNEFLISSFLALYVSVSLDSFPLTSDFGHIQLTLSPSSLSATPLPPAWTMMLIGLAGFGFVAYRRNNKPSKLALNVA